ncbi:type IV conjugative transfer system lipoprotein TraV [Roseateles flavus]|uniref:Type IV conjugative transfer system lipoprotein TraV n=1 Tax=Roseateles flavus TaxID=3149041 RepID=A0ABV0GKI1_9BURK
MRARGHCARALPLVGLLALSGCMSMSGLGGESKYACKAPDGVTCDSVSGTYANALANNLPGQRHRKVSPRAADTAGTADAAPQTPSRPRPTAQPRTRMPAADETAQESPELQGSGLALRAPPRYLRLWVKPWEDIDGDLYDQTHVYVQVDQGRWLIDHVQQRIRQAYAPLRPPPTASSAAPTNDGPSRGESLSTTARPVLPPELGMRSSTEVPR